ncbi:uncharacterized protein HKW66_Vig0114010 [Vigna angularis]|uniref:Uncharacterized protein n=1 Tax=Phaseolus angularis TaxID=3914 RepID=A0A8T0KYJ1_PHAAN|nr:uncharacterized protein HKW66_Vig0114010 [Vigna angularis]
MEVEKDAEDDDGGLATLAFAFCISDGGGYAIDATYPGRRFVYVHRVTATMKEKSETKNKQTTASKERLRFEAPPRAAVRRPLCARMERTRKPKGDYVPLCCWTDEKER